MDKKELSILSNDFNVIKKYIYFIQNQMCFMHERTPADQLQHRNRYITRMNLLMLSLKMNCLELQYQGLLRPKLRKIFSELRPECFDNSSKEDFSLSL